jgi:hypothetical protein
MYRRLKSDLEGTDKSQCDKVKENQPSALTAKLLKSRDKKIQKQT